MNGSSRFVTALVVLGLAAGTSGVVAQETNGQKALPPPTEAAVAQPEAVTQPAAVTQPELDEVTGTLSVTKNDMGLIATAALKIGEGEQVETVAVKLDQAGKRLAWTTPKDRTVKVIGKITEVEGEKTIEVQKFTVLPKQPVKSVQ